YVDRGAQILDTLAHTPRFNRWMAEVIHPFVGPHVLELGAGIGNLTQHFSKGRLSYVATDIDDEHLARLRTRFQARPRVQVRHCDITAPEDFVPFTGQMDTVICLNVVEHVLDDDLALGQIASTLKEGGKAIVL